MHSSLELLSKIKLFLLFVFSVEELFLRELLKQKDDEITNDNRYDYSYAD
jgi:hypothetical protein